MGAIATPPPECNTATGNTIMNANLFARLFDNLDDPHRLAIETLDGRRISYGDLIARAGKVANVLVSRGVKVGDRVAAQTEKSVAGLVLYLGLGAYAVVRARSKDVFAFAILFYLVTLSISSNLFESG